MLSEDFLFYLIRLHSIWPSVDCVVFVWKHYCAFSSEKWIKFTLLPLLKMLHNVWLLRWWMRSCLVAVGKSLEHLVVFLLWFALQWFLDAPPPFLHLLLIFYWVFLGCYSFCLYFCSVPSKVWGGAFAPSPLRLELFALSALAQSELENEI